MKIFKISKSIKINFTILLVFQCTVVQSQVDLKNALPDLTAKYEKAATDQERIKFALTISNFYLSNKASTSDNLDSSLSYTNVAKNLSISINYKQGIEDAELLRVRMLLIQNKLAEAQKIADKTTGSLYCRLHIAIGKYFLEKGGEDKADLDIADTNITAAQNYARLRHMPILLLQALTYRYPLQMERYLPASTYEKTFAEIINDSKKYGRKDIEARIWYAKAANEYNDSAAQRYLKKALSVAFAAKDTGLAIREMKEIADYDFRAGRLDTAERQLKTVLKMYTAAGYKNLQYTYDLLSAVYMAKVNLEAAMRSSLNAVKYADTTGTEYSVNYIQFRLAKICRDLGLKKESIKWSQLCLDNTIKLEKRFPYLVFRELATEMIADGKAELVLQAVADALKKYPDEKQNQVFIPLIRGDCYVALQRSALAEKNYLEAISQFEAMKRFDSYYNLACKNLAEFYIGQRSYNKAEPYLQKILNKPNPAFSVVDLAATHQLQFRIDSAKGNYLSAIKHFEIAKSITDSVLNKTRLKQSEQLQVQFETAQRDHENLILRNKNNLQQSELEKAALNRKFIVVALFSSLLVTGLMVYLYRAKQKNNLVLQQRQNEINEQNDQLSILLKEKEWLMKEIHHRVKNNLQIISSLLHTQSSYLENEQALNAIRDSQNRMQAISIVHQKLYKSNDLSTIDIRKYIAELAESIQDSFEAGHRIKFEYNLANLQLTTADTVPLGLILNEAITNSVKYAFNDRQQALISISLSEIREGYIRLSIRDNGRGLPDDFDAYSCTSLGINLMMGLTEQLNGEFSISSGEGVMISVVFRPGLSEPER